MIIFLFIGFSLNITNVSHIHWSETSESNCHGFEIGFTIDFDLKKSDSISIIWLRWSSWNETFPCKIVRNRHGVCTLSFIESNKKDMWLLFYLNFLTETSRERTNSNHMRSINNTKTAIMKTSFEKGNSSRDNTSRLKPTSLLLKKYKYHLKYEGKVALWSMFDNCWDTWRGFDMHYLADKSELCSFI